MAYPGITEDQYRAAFEQLCEDNQPEAITANLLQKTAGGRYGRAADALERLMSGWRKAQQAQQLIPVQPSWYRDFVTRSLEQHREQLESQWAAIGPHIQERILEATTKLEAERDSLSLKYKKDRAQIELLENELEGMELKCGELQASKVDLDILKQEYQQLQEKYQDKVKLSIDLDNDRKKACSERDALTGKMQLLYDEVNQLRKRFQDESELISKLRIERDNAAVEKQNMSIKLDEANIHLTRQSMDNMSLETRCQEQDKRIGEMVTASNQQVQENRTLVSQVAGLEKELDTFRQREQELIQVLKHKQQEDQQQEDQQQEDQQQEDQQQEDQQQ